MTSWKTLGQRVNIMHENLPKSDHFHLRDLAPGVFAALARPMGQADCNGGIIDLGNRTVVVESLLSPDAADDLRDAALQLTGRPVDLVLLTHHHFDHIWGCQAFEEKVCILSSQQTYRMIEEAGEGDLKQNQAYARDMLKKTQAQLQMEQDENKIAQLTSSIDQLRKRLELIDTIRLRLPDLVCNSTLSVYGSRRCIQFIPFEKAHSTGNSVIYLPEEGIIFMGDLLFTRIHPFMSDGNPQGWTRVLDKIAALEPVTVVPGHGRISTLADIKEMRAYIQLIAGKVQAFVQAGKPETALDEIELPEPYASWEAADLLESSLHGLYQWYST
jgi:cyclase